MNLSDFEIRSRKLSRIVPVRRSNKGKMPGMTGKEATKRKEPEQESDEEKKNNEEEEKPSKEERFIHPEREATKEEEILLTTKKVVRNVGGKGNHVGVVQTVLKKLLSQECPL